MSPAMVLEGVTLHGDINTSDEVLLAHVESAIRRGLPQVWPQAACGERIALVGGGPSLADTEGELVDLIHRGAKLVTLNGAYDWCRARNLRPSAQIVLDAREANARFVAADVPDCRYLLASQCHPAVFEAVADRANVWLWHAVAAREGPVAAALDAYYLQRWTPIPGGTTVAMRALILLRTLGFLRFDLFGIDSCWLDGQHHAFEQPENAGDRQVRCTVAPSDRPDLARDFVCAPWHCQQLDDFLHTVRLRGQDFQLRVHGRGLLAYVLEAAALSADDDPTIHFQQE